MFQKATPAQASVKVSIYGPPGSGKTFTTLLFAEGLAKHAGKRIAYVDSERGTDFYCQEVLARKVHPAAFDFDAIYTQSLAEVDESIRSLSWDEYGVVVIDSISHLWISAIEAWEGQHTKADTIPFQAWAKIKKPYKALLKYLMDSPVHVFIVGRQKNLFGRDDSGELTMLGVGMRAEGETQYEPHVCGHMLLKPRKGEESVPTIYWEKDRTGVLSGRTYPFPNFETIAPLLPLLGDTQAQSENEQERQDKDGELLAKQDEAKVEKADKSAAWLRERQASIAGCTKLADLGELAKVMKKEKRGKLEEHISALTQLFEARRSELVAQEAGGI